jgi:predicted nucleotidyltransferase
LSQSKKPLTLDDLRLCREEILRVAATHGAHNVRVFGSVARGDAGPTNDVDILLDIPGDVGGFAYFGRLADLRQALSAVIGVEVDVIDSAGLRILRGRVLGEAIPL